MDRNSSDDFAHVLSRLRYSLFDDTFNPPSTSKGSPELQEAHALSAVTQHGGSFLQDRTAGIHTRYLSRLEALEKLLGAQLQCLHEEDSFEILHCGFITKIACAMTKLDTEADLFERRLEQQFDTATNRLNELVFECAGEMDKTQRRLLMLEQRQGLHIPEGRSKSNRATDRQMWATLLARMKEDVVEHAEFEDLSGQAFKQALRFVPEEMEEGDHVNFVARARMLPFEALQRRLRGGEQTRGGNTRSNKSSAIMLKCRAGDHADTDLFLNTLCLNEHSQNRTDNGDKAAFRRQLPVGTTELPLYPASTFLASNVFSWLRCDLQVVDPRVYYCIDERAYNHSHFHEREALDGRCKTHSAAEVAKAVESVYCPEPCSRFAQAALLRSQDQEQWPVSKRQSRHRDLLRHNVDKRVSRHLHSFPDVLVSAAEDGHGYFFAPARVHELLETNRFGKWNQKYLDSEQRTLFRRAYSLSEPGVLRKLYIVCQVADSHVLLPVPDQYMDELIATYLVRKSTLQTSIAKVVRDFKHDLVVLKPPTQPDGFLIALSSSTSLAHSGETAQPSALTHKICAWRACLCRCTSTAKTDTLCKFHSDMRRRLSKVTGTANEVKRHLPRSGGALKLRKVSDVLKASSLMSELLNGKLEKTIDGFCTKAANAARPKAKREPKESKLASDVSSSTELLKTQISLCNRVLRVERRVAQELQHFASAGIFPADELAQIREEYTILNEERTALVRVQEHDQKRLSLEERKSVLPTLERKHLAKGTNPAKASPKYRSKGGRHGQGQCRSKCSRNQKGMRGADERRYLLKDFSRIMEENESGGERPEEDNRYVITKGLPLNRVQAETELELEFCLRKLMILKESNVHPHEKLNQEAKRENKARGRTPMRFDSDGYPLPVPTVDGL